MIEGSFVPKQDIVGAAPADRLGRRIRQPRRLHLCRPGVTVISAAPKPHTEVLLTSRRTRLICLLPNGYWHIPCERRKPNTCESESVVKFAIEIGETEKHRLEYNFNQLLGSLVIKVNEKPIKKSLRLINEPVLEVHAFVVGDHEKSSVRIEKERNQLLGCKNRLYVNNRLVKVFSGL